MGISVFHWLIVLAVLAVIIVPVAHILRRVGLSPWWSIVYVIPPIGWVALWIFAYARWPKVDSTGASASAG